MKRMLLVLAVLSAILALSCDNPASDPPVQVVAPTKPANVRIESDTLRWDAVSGAESYKVFLSSDGSTWPAAAAASPTGTSFSPLTASNYYAVTAVNSGGESARSSPLVLYGAPPAPRNLRMETIGADDYLVWDAVLFATKYKAYYWAGATWETQNDNLTDTKCKLGDTGNFSVSAFNSSGEEGDRSATYEFK